MDGSTFLSSFASVRDLGHRFCRFHRRSRHRHSYPAGLGDRPSRFQQHYDGGVAQREHFAGRKLTSTHHSSLRTKLTLPSGSVRGAIISSQRGCCLSTKCRPARAPELSESVPPLCRTDLLPRNSFQDGTELQRGWAIFLAPSRVSPRRF